MLAHKAQALNATAATVLGFLAKDQLSGYELSRTIAKTVGNFWNTTQSQVYREIQALEAAKFIKAGKTETRARRRYAITATGKAAFTAWIHKEPGATLIRDPFFLKVFFANHIDKATMMRFVRAHRASHESRLARLRDVERELEPDEPKDMLQFALRYEETLLQWLETLQWK